MTAGVLTGLLLIGYVLTFTLLDHWVVAGGFRPVTRVVMLAVVLTLCAGIAIRFILMPWFRRIHPLYAARMLDKSSEGLEGSLLTLVDLKAAGYPDVEQMKEAARRSQTPEAGTVRLGMFPTLGPYLLPHLIPGIRAHFPDLPLLLVEEKSDVLLARLRVGRLDAALLALPLHDDQLHAEFLFDEPFLLAVPEQHPLAKLRSLAVEDLARHDLLLLEDGHCLRQQTLEVCHLAGANEKSEFRATSLETLRQMVAAGVGVTLLPALSVHAPVAQPAGAGEQVLTDSSPIVKDVVFARSAGGPSDDTAWHTVLVAGAGKDGYFALDVSADGQITNPGDYSAVTNGNKASLASALRPGAGKPVGPHFLWQLTSTEEAGGGEKGKKRKGKKQKNKRGKDNYALFGDRVGTPAITTLYITDPANPTGDGQPREVGVAILPAASRTTCPLPPRRRAATAARPRPPSRDVQHGRLQRRN